MRLLELERDTLQTFMPGFDDVLSGMPLSELESPDSKGLAAFREYDGPGLLVPADCNGHGANALDAVRVQRAVGARSPSLAVATTMHHFSIAGLAALRHVMPGAEWLLLEAIAANRMLVASGFAEGRTGGGILQPTMSAVAAPDGLRVTGIKRPCSLSRSMDLLTASVQVPRLDGDGTELAVALIPVTGAGIDVTPFWSTFALAGAESDQVAVTDVLVPPELVVRTHLRPGQTIDEVQNAGFVWFELLVSASYLGAASALVERVLDQERVPEVERLRLVVEVEAAMAAIENVARQVPERQLDSALLAQALLVRYAVQGAIARAVPLAVELLGGLAFISADDTAYLAAAVNGLAFHPPSRGKIAGPLLAHLAGAELEIT